MTTINNIIDITYGLGYRYKLREWEKEKHRCVSTKEKLHFLGMCRSRGLVPTTLEVKLPKQISSNRHKLQLQFGLRLVNEERRRLRKVLHEQEQKIRELNDSLYVEMESEDLNNFRELVASSCEKLIHKVRELHKKRLQQLAAKSGQVEVEKEEDKQWRERLVIDKSTRGITVEEDVIRVGSQL